jgi:hypothetical protein
MLSFYAVYTASGDSFIHSYDARSGTLKNKFAGHEYAVNCIVVSRQYVDSVWCAACLHPIRTNRTLWI